MEDLLFTKELMWQYRVDVYKSGLVEFYEWQCDHHSYDGMICNHEGECIKAKIVFEEYSVAVLSYHGCDNDMLMQSWDEIKSMYREYKLNEIGI